MVSNDPLRQVDQSLVAQKAIEEAVDLGKWVILQV
jgi:hypothetical protein